MKVLSRETTLQSGESREIESMASNDSNYLNVIGLVERLLNPPHLSVFRCVKELCLTLCLVLNSCIHRWDDVAFRICCSLNEVFGAFYFRKFFRQKKYVVLNKKLFHSAILKYAMPLLMRIQKQ